MRKSFLLIPLVLSFISFDLASGEDISEIEQDSTQYDCEIVIYKKANNHFQKSGKGIKESV